MGYVLSATLSASMLRPITLKLSNYLSADMTEISSPRAAIWPESDPEIFDNGH
jgi:hypothetical protein